MNIKDFINKRKKKTEFRFNSSDEHKYILLFVAGFLIGAITAGTIFYFLVVKMERELDIVLGESNTCYKEGMDCMISPDMAKYLEHDCSKCILDEGDVE